MMKILTMLYRYFTRRCIYCGTKKECYAFPYDSYYCPTDMGRSQCNGCSRVKKFIEHKEAKVQKALGFFSGPKGLF